MILSPNFLRKSDNIPLSLNKEESSYLSPVYLFIKSHTPYALTHSVQKTTNFFSNYPKFWASIEQLAASSLGKKTQSLSTTITKLTLKYSFFSKETANALLFITSAYLGYKIFLSSPKSLENEILSPNNADLVCFNEENFNFYAGISSFALIMLIPTYNILICSFCYYTGQASTPTYTNPISLNSFLSQH